jgi:thiosulfate dehydrogenase
MRRFLIGLIVGLAVWPIAALCYLRFGRPPVAVTDAPFPLEAQIVNVALGQRISRDLPKPGTPPIQPTEENLLAGAQTYFMNCSTCHGMSNQTSEFAPHMYPDAPQLLKAHGGHGVVGVSDDPPGETYWKVSNGIRLTGMPSFSKILTPTEMWQVSLLLANANKPLSKPVTDALKK